MEPHEICMTCMFHILIVVMVSNMKEREAVSPAMSPMSTKTKKETQGGHAVACLQHGIGPVEPDQS